jgi:hypothetical protein
MLIIQILSIQTITFGLLCLAKCLQEIKQELQVFRKLESSVYVHYQGSFTLEDINRAEVI